MNRTSMSACAAIAGSLCALGVACAPADSGSSVPVADRASPPPLDEVSRATVIRARAAADWPGDSPASRISLTVLPSAGEVGRTLIPAGSTISALVKPVASHAGPEGVDHVRLEFDRVRIGGEIYPIRAELVRVETMPSSGRRFVSGARYRTDGSVGAHGSSVAFAGGDSALVPAGTIFTVRLTESLLVERSRLRRAVAEAP